MNEHLLKKIKQSIRILVARCLDDHMIDVLLARRISWLLKVHKIILDKHIIMLYQ